jgi:DNA-binding SARP family transcriptional activator
MEVGLLGPLQLAEGGQPIPSAGARQQAVLALLALHANQVVPSERVTLELWGEDAPPSAANALQAAVSRLRRVLPEGRLVTRAPGYLLRVAPDELDLGRFERLLTDGREALLAGAAGESTRMLRAALSLWRGAALADFRYEPFAQAEIARLEELRLVCLEERIEADLALGASGELVGELQRLVAEQPFRERVRGQLMLALYRSGRQTDALEAYRELRGVLVDELGLEPAPALRELEAAILRHDPALAGRPAPPQAAPALVRKPVTVLCAELRVASSSGAGLDPEALGAVHGLAQAALTSAVERYGGTLVAAAGGRVLGGFGVAALHEDDALRAARAAVEARSGLDAEAAALEAERGLLLAVRFGVATEEALVGGPDPLGFTGDVLGRAIELAGAAGPGEILVSEATGRLAAAAVEVEPAGSGRLRLHAVRLGARPLPVHLDAPLIGRDAELGLLGEAFASARREQATVLVTVLGEAGVGKTRLVHELAARLDGAATVLTGRCLPYGEGITFWPLRELVRQAGAPEGTREELEALLHGQADAARVAEQLAGALRPGGQGALATAEIFWAARRLLQALAGHRPLLVVFEDLHWAEPTFLDLVESLAAQAGPAPLLLLCLARPELADERPAWASGAARASSVELQPLADEAARALLDALAGAGRLPAPARARLLDAAAGNPLYLEQLAASLGEQRWDQGGPPLPPTIQALLAARLERLGPGEQAVVARAAVLGRDFGSQELAELLPEEARAPLRRHLQALADKGLVQPGPSPARAAEDYSFRHILIQQAVYRAIPKSLRADLHERHAGWLERHSGRLAGEHDELLGYHLEQAARYRGELAPGDEQVSALAGRAAGYLEAAGASAHTRGDALAAVNLLERAAALLPEGDPALARLLTDLGVALTEAGRLDQAAGVLERGQRVAAASRDERLQAHARVQRLLLGLKVDLRGATAEVGRVLPGVFGIFERAGDELGLCRAWRLQAALHWNQATSGAAEDAWQRAAVHARKAGDQRQLIEILGWLASAALWGPTPAPAGIRRSEAHLAQVGGHRTAEAVILLHLAGLYAMQDQVPKAHRLLARSTAILDDLGGTMTSSITEPAAFIAMLAGDPAAAERHLRLDFESLEQMGEKAYLATAAALLAQAIMAQGPERHDEAEQLVAVSQEAGAGEDVSAQVVGQGVLARILAARGRLAEAEELGRGAVALAERTDLLNQHGDALLDLAEVLDAAGRADQARATVDEALGLYHRKGNLLGAAGARRRLERYART